MSKPSTKSFNVEPIGSLLEKPLHELSLEEKEEYVKRLAKLRQSPQALRQQLNREAEAAGVKPKTKRSGEAAAKRKKELDDEYDL